MCIKLSLLKIAVKYGIDSIINLIKKCVRCASHETGMVLVYINMT